MQDLVLEKIENGIQRIMSNPALRGELAGWKRTVRIKVDGDNYTVKVADGSITATREKTRSPDVEIRVNRATFMEIASGNLPFTTAYLRGLLTVKGDVHASDITRLQNLL